MFINNKHNKVFFTFIGLLSTFCSYAQTWTALLEELNGDPAALYVHNNILYAGGSFNVANGIIVNNVASWNGYHWDSLGTGASFGGPNCFSAYNNQLYAAGQFTDMAGVPYTYKIARWNGSQWLSASSSNNVVGTINSLITYNNQLYAAGNITTMDGLNVNRIAKWNGSNWSSVGGGVTGGFGDIRAMAVYKGQLYVGGDFGYAGGKQTNYIARWNGSVWDSVGMGLDYFVTSMVVDSVADILYVAGAFGHAGSMNTLAIGVAKWNGNVWSAVGSDTLDETRVLEMYHNELYAGGSHAQVGINGESLKYIYRWDGSQWHSVGGGTNETVTALEVYKDTLYVGGGFTQAGSIPANYIAKWFSPNETAVKEKKNEIEYLGNNIPNPFNNTTSIPYFVPIGSTGVLEITDMRGKLIKSYTLTGGHNQLEVWLNEYCSSVYFYTLNIDDGRIVRHKKMLLNK